MAQVLIITKPDDIHAVLVKLALEKKGHQPILWQIADFPIQQAHTFFINSQGFFWKSKGVDFEIDDHAFDVVWYRRTSEPTLSSEIHPDDKVHAEKECLMFHRSFWEVIAPNAFWVNRPEKARSANSKLLQMKLANQLNLNVPETIISNNSESIKSFIKMHQKKGVVYKTLYPMSWENPKDYRLAYCSEVNLEKLPSDQALGFLPGVFQVKLEKAYELRVTYFGAFSVAVKINSQAHSKGKIDWRYVPTEELSLEPYILPKTIHEKCKALMQELGIVFGCFDLVVTPDGEYHFLEVNQAGQFLWIEKILPEIKMLDIFTDFLIYQKYGFEWKENRDDFSVEHFFGAAEQLREQYLEMHILNGD